MEGERPRVFQPNTVTVVIGDGAQSVYAGPDLLEMASHVECAGLRPTVVFRRPSGEAERTRLDEEVRRVRAAGHRFTLA